MNFKTKPRGDQVSFVTDCHRCAGELTISNGRPDNHTCEPRIDMPSWQDALADYYDSGAIGEAPRPKRLEDIRFT